MDAPTYACGAGENVPFIDCAAVLSGHGDEVTLFLVNKNLEKDIFCKVALSDFSCESVIEWITLGGYAPDVVNTAEYAPVQPTQCQGATVTLHDVSFTLPKASWNMLRLRIAYITPNCPCLHDSSIFCGLSQTIYCIIHDTIHCNNVQVGLQACKRKIHPASR